MELPLADARRGAATSRQWEAATQPNDVGLAPAGMMMEMLGAENETVKKVLDGKELARSFAGGTGLALGAMIGGGCTTGAFISAWPTLSLGSFAMAGTFFAASMAVANGRLLARTLDLGAAQQLGDRAYD